MSSSHDRRLGSTFSTEIDEEIAAHGIARVPVDYFHWRDFRYTKLTDAVAQAKHAQQTDQCSQESNSSINPEAEDQVMRRYAITRIPIDYFYWRDFRYSNVEDAMAQAKRSAAVPHR